MKEIEKGQVLKTEFLAVVVSFVMLLGLVGCRNTNQRMQEDEGLTDFVLVDTIYPQEIDWEISFVDLPTAERQLLEWITNHSDYEQSRDRMSGQMFHPFITLVKGHPETMEYEFNELPVHSVKSKDGRLKLYS